MVGQQDLEKQPFIDADAGMDKHVDAEKEKARCFHSFDNLVFWHTTLAKESFERTISIRCRGVMLGVQYLKPSEPGGMIVCVIRGFTA